jgi:hypothetical protein
LKTLPKQLSGSLPSDIALHVLTFWQDNLINFYKREFAY